jgi:TctA family transporter
MDLINNITLGFQTALTLANLFYCLIGVFLGTLIGVLPGLGPTATIAMLLPLTFALPPISSLIMLAGIYYGSQYGGSTTSILVNLPGEAASVVTTLDGYQMAKQGRAGVALATSAIGSFFAGTVATFLIAAFGPPLAAIALRFGPAEYFSLMTLGLVASIVLAQGSLLHAFGMVVLGLLLGLVGTDVTSGVQRFTFDTPELADGIGFVTVAMGMFGLGEIIRNLETEAQRRSGGKDHHLDADARRLEANDRADFARHGGRLGFGNFARQRFDSRGLCCIFDRKESLKEPSPIRQGRYRRRRRA